MINPEALKTLTCMMGTIAFQQIPSNILRRTIMWTKPAVTEMRFGFEVTMYVCNR